MSLQFNGLVNIDGVHGMLNGKEIIVLMWCLQALVRF